MSDAPSIECQPKFEREEKNQNYKSKSNDEDDLLANHRPDIIHYVLNAYTLAVLKANERTNQKYFILNAFNRQMESVEKGRNEKRQRKIKNNNPAAAHKIYTSGSNYNNTVLYVQHLFDRFSCCCCRWLEYIGCNLPKRNGEPSFDCRMIARHLHTLLCCCPASVRSFEQNWLPWTRMPIEMEMKSNEWKAKKKK